jgi:hypothetical protein
MKADCPKCGSPNARYQKSDYDLTLVCTCGFRKVVFTTLDTLEIMHNSSPADAKLPRVGTHLHNTLVCLSSIEPANSREVTDTLTFQGFEYTVSDVSSYLMMLRTRGLVEVLEYKRGVPGGSTWELTAVANELLGVHDGA